MCTDNQAIAKELHITPQAVDCRLRTEMKNLRSYFQCHYPQFVKVFGP